MFVCVFECVCARDEGEGWHICIVTLSLWCSINNMNKWLDESDRNLEIDLH